MAQDACMTSCKQMHNGSAACAFNNAAAGIAHELMWLPTLQKSRS